MKKQPWYATVGTGPRTACLTSSYITNSCTPRKKQPSYATVGTGPREACLTSTYVTNSTKRCDNNHAQRAFLTFGCSSLRQIAEALAKRWQRLYALAQYLLLGALQGVAVVEKLFVLEEILESRYQARTVIQHVANLEMLGESEGFQSGAVRLLLPHA